jgi:hypothetical protein
VPGEADTGIDDVKLQVAHALELAMVDLEHYDHFASPWSRPVIDEPSTTSRQCGSSRLRKIDERHLATTLASAKCLRELSSTLFLSETSFLFGPEAFEFCPSSCGLRPLPRFHAESGVERRSHVLYVLD